MHGKPGTLVHTSSRVARLSRSPYPFYLCLSFLLIPAPSGCHLENTPVFANPLLAGGPTSPKQQRRQPHCNTEYGEYTEKSCSRRKVSVKRSVSRACATIHVAAEDTHANRCDFPFVYVQTCHQIISRISTSRVSVRRRLTVQSQQDSHCLGYVDCL